MKDILIVFLKNKKYEFAEEKRQHRIKNEKYSTNEDNKEFMSILKQKKCLERANNFLRNKIFY